MCYHLLEREDTFEAVVIIHHVDVIDIVEVFGLSAHLFETIRHGEVFIHHDHLRAHKTAGGVLVILKKVYDITGLFHVVDMRDHLIAVLLVEFLYKVDGIVSVEEVDIMAYLLRVHTLKQFLTVFLIELHQHVSFLLLILDKIEEPLGLFQVKVLEKLGNISGVHLFHLVLSGFRVLGVDNLLDAFYVGFVKIPHNSTATAFAVIAKLHA